MLVSTLPERQKPEGPFMAPTYSIGGFNSSHTRQGGINFFIKLVAMIFVLLGEKTLTIFHENFFRSACSDFSIDFNVNYLSNNICFSSPKALLKS